MRIVCLTATWKRDGLTAVFWQWSQYCATWWAPHEVIWVAAVSDPGHALLARAAGADLVQTLNKPLGAKFNAALRRAAEHNPDVVVITGSDDFWCERVAAALLTPIVEGDASYVGLGDLYFYHARYDQMRYWAGYTWPGGNYPDRRGEPAGPGRVIRADVLQQLKWMLWDPGRHRGMDHSSMRNLTRVGAMPHLIECRPLEGIAVDVKGFENLSAWGTQSDPVLPDTTPLDRLPAPIAEGLRALRTPRRRRDMQRRHTSPTQRLVFTKNVTYRGANYGPDFNTDPVDVDGASARQFIYQRRAIPAPTEPLHLGHSAETDVEEPAAAADTNAAETADPEPEAQSPVVRTSEPGTSSPPRRTKRRRKKSRQ